MKAGERDTASQTYRLEMEIRERMSGGPCEYEVLGAYTMRYAPACIRKISLKLWEEAFRAEAKKRHLAFGRAYQEALETGHLEYIKITRKTEPGAFRVFYKLRPSYPAEVLDALEPTIRAEKRAFYEFHMDWNERPKRRRQDD